MRPGTPRKMVIDIIHSIQADADIGKGPISFSIFCFFRCNQGAVRGDYRAHPFFDGHRPPVPEGPHGQVVSPPESKRTGTPVSGQVINQNLSLCGRHFIISGMIIRMGITMDTLQITPPGHIPDHYRDVYLSKTAKGGMEGIRNHDRIARHPMVSTVPQ